MQALLVGAGIALVAASIVGGGLKGFNVEVPVLDSIQRQIGLGSFGVGLLVLGLLIGGDDDEDDVISTTTTTSESSPPTSESGSSTTAVVTTTSIAVTSTTTVTTDVPTTTGTVANVAVPDVVGRTPADAQFEVEAIGLRIDVTEEETTQQEPGLIVRQEPPATTGVAENSIVRVFVALGPFCDGERATLLVRDGSEFTGTGGSDVIVSVSDQPVDIGAGGGDDRVCLSAAGGRVFGEQGNDRILGSSGEDVVFGGDGSDFIVGGGGDDLLSGEDQTVSSSRGDDEIRGDDGNDLVFGGDDTLSGGAGADSLFGAEGDDVIQDGVGDDAAIDAGEGVDSCPGLGKSLGEFAHCESW
jgi:Ca2+-binding RTX toxin-like protein